MKTVIPLIMGASALCLAPGVQAQSAPCPDPDTAPAEIERTIDTFFDALREKDGIAFKAVTTPLMYSFDVGERFDGTELVDAVTGALSQGIEINWSLGPKDTKLRCDVAWSAWENEGSAGPPGDVKRVRWLESAVLVHQDGRWKIDFFHSQRARED